MEDTNLDAAFWSAMAPAGHVAPEGKEFVRLEVPYLSQSVSETNETANTPVALPVQSETSETSETGILQCVGEMLEKELASGVDHSATTPEARKASIVKALKELTPEEREYSMYVSQGMVSKDRQANSKHKGYKLSIDSAVAIVEEALRMVRKGGDVSAVSIVSKIVPAPAVKSVLQRSFTTKAKQTIFRRISTTPEYKGLVELYGKGYVHGFFSVGIGKAIRHLTAQAKLLSRLTKLETEAAAGIEALARVEALEVVVASLKNVRSAVKEVKTSTVKRAVDSELMSQIETAQRAGHTTVRAIAEATGIDRNKVHRMLKAAAATEIV